MAELIQSSVSDIVTRVRATQSPEANNSQGEQSSQQTIRDVNNRANASRGTDDNLRDVRMTSVSTASHQSSASDLLSRPDKVVHILNGWKIKYSGGGVPVDNFIYRVEALTRETLGNNFSVLCKNASVLFEGKANEFYWRYHKAHGEVRWDNFCSALRLQFRQNRDDGDIEELIRNTKQKPNETFDCFYDNISDLVDQLEQPWAPNKLVRVLKNNLRTEIRHELLNLDIKTVSDLRDICRRREVFLADAKRYQGYIRNTPFKRDVSEFAETSESLQETESENEGDISALALSCWNCRKEGHRYQDCVTERRIFCYGCGAANTYKPSCGKCSKNSKPGTSRSLVKQKPSSAVRSQATMTD